MNYGRIEEKIMEKWKEEWWINGRMNETDGDSKGDPVEDVAVATTLVNVRVSREEQTRQFLSSSSLWPSSPPPKRN